jgi:hypothetical protein
MNLCAIDKHLNQNDARSHESVLAQASLISKVGLLRSRLLQGVDADEFSRATFIFKFHDAIDQGEERVVFTSANVITRLPTSAALTGNYVAAKYMLSTKFL